MTQKDIELRKNADQILQEIRIVLPGTQALMGFQFIAFFNPVFQALSHNLKTLHFAALILTIICSILLIAPVTFQQIGEGGSVTEKFLSYTRKMLSVAMLCLLLAMTADVFLAAKTIQVSTPLAAGMSALLFIAGIYVWYIYALRRRKANGN